MPSPPTPVFRPLDRPRPPSPGEWALLEALAAAGGPALVDQVRSCSVVGECRCGCASVQLRSVATPLPADVVCGMSRRGRDDHVAVSADGRDPAGRQVDVVLHVVLGSPAELEVFDPFAGEGRHVDPATIGSLSRPELS